MPVDRRDQDNYTLSSRAVLSCGKLTIKTTGHEESVPVDEQALHGIHILPCPLSLPASAQRGGQLVTKKLKGLTGPWPHRGQESWDRLEPAPFQCLPVQN